MRTSDWFIGRAYPPGEPTVEPLIGYKFPNQPFCIGRRGRLLMNSPAGGETQQHWDVVGVPMRGFAAADRLRHSLRVFPFHPVLYCNET